MISPQTIDFAEGPDTPNNQNLPVLIYRKVFSSAQADKDKLFQSHFEKSGWRGTWKGVIFDHNHFHSNAHEALGIAKGHVTVHLGGERGKDFDLEAGDLIVLPAGTGHQMIKQSESLVVIGSYPEGQADYDIYRSLKEHPDAKERIAQLPLPKSDPFYGTSGPLLNLWHK